MHSISCLLLLLISSLASAQLYAFYQNAHDATTTSGFIEALTKGLGSSFAITDESAKKEDKKTVSMTNILATITQVDTSGMQTVFDPVNTFINITNVTVIIEVTFKYEDEVKLKKDKGNGTIYLTTAPVGVSIIPGINVTSGLPDYKGTFSAFSFNSTQANLTISSNNATTIADLWQYLLSNVTIPDVNSYGNAQVTGYLNNFYASLSSNYQHLYNYQFYNTTTSTDFSLLSMNLTNSSISFSMAGSIVGVPPPNATLPAFDSTLGTTQAQFSVGFFSSVIDYLISLKAVSTNLTAGSVAIEGFDFKWADIWVIFPESMSDFEASDDLSMNCAGDLDSPSITELDPDHGAVQVLLSMKCSLINIQRSIIVLQMTIPMRWIVKVSIKESQPVVTFDDLTMTKSPTIIVSRYFVTEQINEIIEEYLRLGMLSLSMQGNLLWGSAYSLSPFTSFIPSSSPNDYITSDGAAMVFYWNTTTSSTSRATATR